MNVEKLGQIAWWSGAVLLIAGAVIVIVVLVKWHNAKSKLHRKQVLKEVTREGFKNDMHGIVPGTSIIDITRNEGGQSDLSQRIGTLMCNRETGVLVLAMAPKGVRDENALSVESLRKGGYRYLIEGNAWEGRVPATKDGAWRQSASLRIVEVAGGTMIASITMHSEDEVPIVDAEGRRRYPGFEFEVAAWAARAMYTWENKRYH